MDDFRSENSKKDSESIAALNNEVNLSKKRLKAENSTLKKNISRFTW